jgi:hypothetical protein
MPRLSGTEDARCDAEVVNDLARRLDELQERRRERLLVGTTQTGDGENCNWWAFYLLETSDAVDFG